MEKFETKAAEKFETVFGTTALCGFNLTVAEESNGTISFSTCNGEDDYEGSRAFLTRDNTRRLRNYLNRILGE